MGNEIKSTSNCGFKETHTERNNTEVIVDCWKLTIGNQTTDSEQCIIINQWHKIKAISV